MHNRSYSYLDENKLLFKNQFGFRHGHSTEHARFELIEQISESLNRNNYFSGIFKAFHTVDHQIFKKLHFYGIREKTLKWFSSCFSNRKQCIENMIEEVKKTVFLYITCGVLQGSILCLLLFITYINDLHCVSNKLQFINI